MTKRIIYGVGAVLMNAQDLVLIQQRSATDRFPGKWEFPGGKIDEGESPIIALMRELKEEIGVEVEEKDLQPLGFITHDCPEFHLTGLIYTCRKWKGEPKPLEGQQGLEWVNVNALEDYDLLLKTRDAIPYLLKVI